MNKQLNTRWVFQGKRDEQGNVTKYKARLVAKGFMQKENFDFKETYAPDQQQDTQR